MAKKAYENLSPGGWYEIQDMQIPVFCDGETLDSTTSPVMKWQAGLIDRSKKLGRSLGESDKYKAIVENAGFQNVVETIYRWPTNSWPKDPKLKELSKWNLVNFDAGLEGVSLVLFTRVLGWSKAEILTLYADVRKKLRNPKVHGYWKIYVVYGRKPKTEERKL